jgi:hypothetical protein
MDINGDYIKEYESIMESTNLQRGYQELIKFFRYLKIYLEKEMTDYKFTGNIVENNMDYSYFQFYNEIFKNKGLKIVVVYVHKTCNYEVWLSGINRQTQVKYYEKIKGKKYKYELTSDPNRFDYILKEKIIEECNYKDLNNLLIKMSNKIQCFIDDIKAI